MRHHRKTTLTAFVNTPPLKTVLFLFFLLLGFCFFRPLSIQAEDLNQITIPVPPEKTSPSAIVVSSQAISMNIGEHISLSYTLDPADNSVSVEYHSENDAVASVDASGVITANSEGTATIMLTSSEGVTLTIPVTVVPGILIKKLSLSYIKGTSITLAKNQERRLFVNISPSNATNQELSFHSSNPKTVQVSEDGLVTARKTGLATITISPAGSDEVSLTLDVQVISRKNSFSPDLSTLNLIRTSSAFYSYARMSQDLSALSKRYGDCMSYHSLGKSYDGRNLYEVILGNPDAPKKVMITAAIHGREYMTALLTMKQIEYYCHYYYDGIYNGTYYSELFHDVAFYIMPMVNPDGVTISQSGPSKIRDRSLRNYLWKLYKRDGSSSTYFRLWKANGRGVDLNRNFNCYWNISENSTHRPSNKDYKGKFPESELETQILVKRFRSLSPDAEIGYHATGSIIYHDYGQTGRLAKQNAAFYRTLQNLTGYSPAPRFNKKLAAGFGDWITNKKKVPSLCVEIGINSAPLSIREFPSIFSRNLYVYAATAELFQS